MKKWLIFALITIISITAIIMVSIYTKTELYSSVIIDCSKMGLNRAMAPKVLNTGGKEIYPGSVAAGMNMKEVIEGGIVTYENSIEKAKKEILAGDNPLILKAMSVEGIIKSDPVITDSDANKLTNADNIGKFLRQRRVILVQ